MTREALWQAESSQHAAKGSHLQCHAERTVSSGPGQTCDGDGGGERGEPHDRRITQ